MSYIPGINPPDAPPLSGGGGGRLFFGNMIVINGTPYPITVSHMTDAASNSRYGKEIADNFDNVYSAFYVDIFYDNSGTTEESLLFNTLQDLVDHINANVQHNSTNINEHVLIKLYADITQDGFGKVYGMNQFYSILKGRKSYKKAVAYVGANSTMMHWNGVNQFIIDLWQYAYGLNVSSQVNDAKKATWFAQNYKNIYSLNKVGHHIDWPNGQKKGRYVHDNLIPDFAPLGSAPSFYVISDVFYAYATVINAQNVNYQFAANLTPDVFNSMESALVVYKVHDHSSTDIRALMIKPLGMDIFRLGWVDDPLNKTLYAIGYNGIMDVQPKVRKFSHGVSDDSSSISNDTSYTITYSMLRQLIVDTRTKAHYSMNVLPRTTRFFYVESKGSISSLSAPIVPVYGRNTVFRLLVGR